MWPFSSKDVDADPVRQRGVLPGPNTNATVINALAQQQPQDDTTSTAGIHRAHAQNALATQSEVIGAAGLSEAAVDDTQRLSMHPLRRLFLVAGVTAFAGFGIGSAVGSTQAGLRYRAENAHNPPRSTAGWYLYNKSKNYHVVLGGLKEGIKAGSRYAGWGALFLGLEEGLDRARGKMFASKLDREEGRGAEGQKDFLSTVSAAVAVVGIGARWNNWDPFTTSRSIKSVVKFALVFGLGQDLLSAWRSEGPWYVRLLRDKIGSQQAIKTAQAV